MIRVAVTGGIACGKSLVGSFLGDQGVEVCEADDLAHALMRPGRPVFREIVRVFGEGFLGSGGDIDRQRLGQRVFASREDLIKLNSIVHPAVKKEWEKWLKGRERGCRVAAVIIPLLYEVDEGEGWDGVVCVGASLDVQLSRLRGRGLSDEDAMGRIKAQMPVAEKMARADYVVVNSGTRDLLGEQTKRVLKSILEKERWERETAA